MQPKRPRRIVHPSAERPISDEHGAHRSRTAPEPGPVRLSKRMAALGICSRREADAWIEKGWVRVDGSRVTQLGTRVLPQQRITIDRAAHAEQQNRVTILLNKPIGWVSGQAEQGHKPASMLITAATHWKDDPSGLAFRPEHLRGLAPAGRLDIDSTGLLVLTQDGRIARQLIGSDANVEKEYLVRVTGVLSDAGLERLRHGLVLDDVPLRRAQVSWLNEDQLRFVLTEGRNRQIRRMCDMVGLEVLALKRVRIGSVVLGRLPRGQWRYLGAGERF
jgi:23S rRNA pseudouridine2604 synthase